MARNKQIYTTSIAISPEDKKYIRRVRLEKEKHTDAGTLAMIIEFYRNNKNETKI